MSIEKNSKLIIDTRGRYEVAKNIFRAYVSDVDHIKDRFKKWIDGKIITKNKELKNKLNESIEKNVELTKENGNFKRQDIIDEASKDLAETQKEKFTHH